MSENTVMGEASALKEPTEAPLKSTAVVNCNVSDELRKNSNLKSEDDEVNYIVVIFLIFIMLVNTSILQWLYCVYRYWKGKCCGRFYRFVKMF